METILALVSGIRAFRNGLQCSTMVRALRAVDLTTDPVDGKQREVWSTGQTHPINRLTDVVDSPTPPQGNFAKLRTAP